MTRSYRMLVAEPDNDVVGLIDAIVGSLRSIDVEIATASTFRESVRTLITDGRFDAAVVDLRLPDLSIPISLEELSVKVPRTALVALTENCDSDLELIRSGVSECLELEQLSPRMLQRAVTSAVERKSVERRLLRMADHDPLTGIGNRRQLSNRYEVLRAERPRRGGELVGAVFNLDGFEEFNSQFGLRAGDDALRQLAMVLLEQVRLEDAVARLGGDEFAIAMLDESTTNAEAIVRRIHSATQAAARELAAPIGVSAGAAFTTDDTSLRDLLAEADLMLSEVKTTHPGEVHFAQVQSAETV